MRHETCDARWDVTKALNELFFDDDEGGNLSMSSAGLGGKNDTDWTNTPHNDEKLDPDMMPEGAATDETLSDVNGEPIGMIEVVEIETTNDGLDALGLEPTVPRFRWWYVPAMALPVAAGATAGAIWLSRRRRQPVGMYQRLALQGRGLLDQVQSRRNKRQATTPWQQGLTAMRESAKGLPDQASALRDRSAEALAAIDVAALLDQSRGIWSNALDQVSTLWERNAPAAKGVAKRATKTSRLSADMMRGQAAQVGQWLAAMRAADTAATARKVATARAAQASDLASDMQKRVNQWLRQQRAQRTMAAAKNVATMRTVAPLASAARSTGKSVQKTGRSINRSVKQARAFSFGILMGAMVTYVRVWRTRVNERELRETAGGRMVRDPNGPVEAGALLP